MDTIRYFKLTNKGGFVARIHVSYRRDGEENWKEWSGSGDICLHAEKTQDLSAVGIEDGTRVRLIAFVAGGIDKLANEEYIFSASASKTASYKITGTTLISTLSLEGCS